VVAEGVETNEQVNKLKELHCKYAQGFYFSRPINSDEAQVLLLTRGFAERDPAPVAPEPVATVAG
jgi:EAL domain-containing protein (putative c-di-GMP-specific phosphodiesterase class I)